MEIINDPLNQLNIEKEDMKKDNEEKKQLNNRFKIVVTLLFVT